MATINTDNHSIGGVDLYFENSIAHASLLATAGTLGSPFRKAGRNLGNIVTAEIAPDITYVEHFVSKLGKRKKDKVAANTESLTIPFTFDEINEDNMQKFFVGSSLASNQIGVLQNPLQEGSVSMIFRTDVGTSMVFSIPKAVIRPDGNLAMNTEDWWSAPMVIEALNLDNNGTWANMPYGQLDLI